MSEPGHQPFSTNVAPQGHLNSAKVGPISLTFRHLPAIQLADERCSRITRSRAEPINQKELAASPERKRLSPPLSRRRLTRIMTGTTDQTLAAPIDDQRELERGFSSYQSRLVALLAFVQFTIILDFIIMSPLGAILMPALDITAGQFGVAVSAYAFSAGISGVLAAGFADRFDRKNLLLFFYAGFTAGTFFCAIAPNYQLLLLGRIVTGLFGGVVGSIVL